MDNKKSGVDSLIDALKASGAPVDDKIKTGQKSNNNSKKTSSTSTSSKSTNQNTGANYNGNIGDIPKAIMDLPIVDKAKNMKRKGKIISFIVILIILGIAYWWFHPPINIQSETTWLIFLILFMLPLFLFFRFKKNKYKISDDDKKKSQEKKTQQAKAASSKSEKTDDTISDDILPEKKSSLFKRYKYLCFIPLGFGALALIGLLFSASFFPGNAYKYAEILKTDNLDFEKDIAEVDYNQIPVIDRDTARVLGTKEMGTIPDYVSQFEISDLYSQINFRGKPVRVSCLNYADLFKWLTNRDEGIPAYCIIDMATQDASIVRISEVDGTTGQGIKYSESEPLARNIERYVQLKYPFEMLAECSFQIDDGGHPWWFCPLIRKTIGLFGGQTIYSVVKCDAVTGECTKLDLDDVPTWVDQVYPSSLLLTQFNWYGKYSNGWLNSWLGQSGVVKTTPGTSFTSNSSSGKTKTLGYNYIAKDDDVWVYTGVTSATSDTSIVGFILMNTRTAESHFYSIAGATEVSAMESAEGQVQHLRYSAAFPILINISNVPTYFIALKDAAGLVKKFAMIDIQRYQNVATGDSVAECQKNYQALLTREGIDMSSSDAVKNNIASGAIATMGTAVIDNNSHVYFTIVGDPHIYDAALPGMLKIMKYKVGDQITISYGETGETATVLSIE